MLRRGSLSLPERTPARTYGRASELKAGRVRLTLSVALYGGALGVAALLVSILAQARFPEEPQHMALLPSVFLSSVVVLVGAVLSGSIAYLVGETPDRARNLLVWGAFGFGYGVLLMFFTGMVIPVTMVFLDLATGAIGMSDVLVALTNSMGRSVHFAFVYGALNLFTGMLAGVLFGAGAWLIDTTNASRDTRIRRYGPVAITMALSFSVVAVAAVGPPSTLAKLGF